jgi:hypothetical protein
MNENGSKTIYRPRQPKYLGLALVVDPKDKRPDTIYKPLQRRGKGLEPSEDPAERKRDAAISRGILIAFVLAVAVICYLNWN